LWIGLKPHSNSFFEETPSPLEKIIKLLNKKLAKTIEILWIRGFGGEDFF
jgi:hypothetical protein